MKLKFKKIRDICKEKFINVNFDKACLLLVGSYVGGYETLKSDLDLILIIEEYEDFYSKYNYLVEVIDGVRVEILLMTPDYYLNCLSDIYKKGVCRDLHRSHKFTNNKVVLGEEYYNELVVNFDFKAYLGKQVERFQRKAANTFEDILGVDSNLALLQFWQRDLINLIIDCFLYKKEDFFDKTKWRVERLKKNIKINEKFILDDYIKYMLYSSVINKESIWVNDTTVFLNRIQLISLFKISDKSLYYLSILSKSSCVQVMPYLIVRVGGVYVLYGKDKSYKIDDITSILFLITYGICLDEDKMYLILKFFEYSNFSINQLAILKFIEKFSSLKSFEINRV
ncbi:nucleotidyltransferase domain-containing protein [Acinetobacter baumannii]|nr:nucleotidyltransferase domain-containing protein [Acinetobacter baumannii]